MERKLIILIIEYINMPIKNIYMNVFLFTGPPLISPGVKAAGD